MKCSTLYSEQIEDEKDGNLGFAQFTDFFSDDDYGHPWICPNATIMRVDEQVQLSVDIVTCETANGGVYAGNATCSTASYSGGFIVKTRLVSSNLAADQYFKTG